MRVVACWIVCSVEYGASSRDIFLIFPVRVDIWLLSLIPKTLRMKSQRRAINAAFFLPLHRISLMQWPTKKIYQPRNGWHL